jgi:hypothetical protein
MALYVRSACQALAEAMGLDFSAVRDPTIPLVPTGRSPWTALHELVEADLADLMVRSDRPADDPAFQRASQAAAVLRRVDALGPAFDRAEQAELEKLLGCEVSGPADGLRRLDERIRRDDLACADLDLLTFLAGRADRQCRLLRPAMGAMADGHFSPID